MNHNFQYPEPPSHSFAAPPEGHPLDTSGLLAAAEAARAAKIDFQSALYDGIEFRQAIAAADARAAAKIAQSVPLRYATWLVAVDAAVAAASELTASITDKHRRDADAAVAAALSALDEFLGSATGYGDGPESRLARAEAEMVADRLRRDYWRAFDVAHWLHRPGFRVPSHPSSRSMSGWPLGGLSGDSRRNLDALLDAGWSPLLTNWVA